MSEHRGKVFIILNDREYASEHDNATCKASQFVNASGADLRTRCCCRIHHLGIIHDDEVPLFLRKTTPDIVWRAWSVFWNVSSSPEQYTPRRHRLVSANCIQSAEVIGLKDPRGDCMDASNKRVIRWQYLSSILVHHTAIGFGPQLHVASSTESRHTASSHAHHFLELLRNVHESQPTSFWYTLQAENAFSIE